MMRDDRKRRMTAWRKGPAPSSLARLWRALAAVLIVAAPSSVAVAKPERIVSLNVCSDQLLMQLVERERIASVTFLAVNPAASALADEAVGLTLNHGLAEEILPLEPDLVLASEFTTRSTVGLLIRLGYPVVQLPVASDIDDVRANIRRVAEAVEEVERGERLLAAFDARLAAARPPQLARRPVAALYWGNSYTSGRGALVSSAVEAAGFENLAVKLQLSGTVQLPLEILLIEQPEALVMGRLRDEEPALASEIFRHPALQKAFAELPSIRIPDALVVCGVPAVAEAVERLQALHGTTINHLSEMKR